MEARKGGFGVYTGCIEDFKPKESYDVAVLANVLEHSYPFRLKALLGKKEAVETLGKGNSGFLRKKFCPDPQIAQMCELSI